MAQSRVETSVYYTLTVFFDLSSTEESLLKLFGLELAQRMNWETDDREYF